MVSIQRMQYRIRGLDHEYFKDYHIGLYFSGSWCQACREFTPVLARAWRDNANFEVIWISVDRNERDAWRYWKRMPWPRMDFYQAATLGDKLYDAVESGDKTFPRFVMLDKDRNVINPDAGEQVEKKEKFPWPAQA